MMAQAADMSTWYGLPLLGFVVAWCDGEPLHTLYYYTDAHYLYQREYAGN